MVIGIFDSGIGGLSLVRALFDRLTGLNVIYFADLLHMPYGEKSEDEISSYSRRIIE